MHVPFPPGCTENQTNTPKRVSQFDEDGCLDDLETNGLCDNTEETVLEWLEGLSTRAEVEDTGLEAVSGASASVTAPVEMKGQADRMARDLIVTLSSHNFCSTFVAQSNQRQILRILTATLLPEQKRRSSE